MTRRRRRARGAVRATKAMHSPQSSSVGPQGMLSSTQQPAPTQASNSDVPLPQRARPPSHSTQASNPTRPTSVSDLPHPLHSTPDINQSPQAQVSPPSADESQRLSPPATAQRSPPRRSRSQRRRVCTPPILHSSYLIPSRASTSVFSSFITERSDGQPGKGQGIDPDRR